MLKKRIIYNKKQERLHKQINKQIYTKHIASTPSTPLTDDV